MCRGVCNKYTCSVGFIHVRMYIHMHICNVYTCILVCVSEHVYVS